MDARTERYTDPRWDYRVHVEGDRRKPFGHVGQRTAEPIKLTANQVSARMLAGIAFGVVMTLLCLGTPW